MSKQKSFALQGAFGAFSHQAAIRFFDQLESANGEKTGEAQYISCQNFAEIFEKVSSGDAAYGVIPLENSSIGSIVANYDLLWTSNAYIVQEIFIPVSHNLIGFENTAIESITNVYSHPAALDQCRQLFKRNKQMKAQVHWDTSGSVLFVKESGNKNWAAIASSMAADEHGMHILETGVEDFTHNATRFGLVVGCDDPKSMEKPQAPYKISCAAEVEHKPGSLANLLWGLSQHGANLTKIESRPIAETPWHYRFFMDIIVDNAAKDEKILAAMSKNSSKHKILGRYNPA